MFPTRRHRDRFLAFALVGLALPAAAAEQAGVAAAVRGEVVLARAQLASRDVKSGEEILMQDSLRSGARSGMQILLLDETVFTIGPDSAVVVDEFVYDPATKQGKVNARITKGVFRFVTGWIPKQDPKDLEVQLPSGTLGVRGTIVGGSADPVTKSSLLVLLGEGQDNDTNSPSGAFEACNAGECKLVNRAGYGLTIGGPGEPPSEPFRVPLEDLRRITGAVSDPGGVVDVASGIEGAEAEPHEGMSQDDGRAPSEVAGEGTNGTEAGFVQRRLEGVDALDGLTDNAQQDARGPGDGRLLDQIVANGAQGQGVASFRRSIGSEDGGYDFRFTVDLGTRTGELAFENIRSETFGIQGGALSGISSPTVLNGRDVFSAAGVLQGGSETLCDGGCQAVGVASLPSLAAPGSSVEQVLGVRTNQPGALYQSLTPADQVLVPQTAAP